MRTIYVVAGFAVLGIGLAGWATLARGQSGTGRLPAPGQVNPADSGMLPGQRSALPTPVPPPNPRLDSVVMPASAPPPPLPAQSLVISAAGPAAPDAKRPKAPTLEDRAGPALNPPSEIPAARPDPAVSIEWVGSPALKIRQPAEYSLVVRNPSALGVQQVQARVRVPKGLTVTATEPKGTVENGMLTWELGAMAPHQERILLVRLLAETRGDLTPEAWVTFTCASTLRLHVHEPCLVLKAQAPDQILVGEAANIAFTVTNTGDAPADKVKIEASLSEGLEHGGGKQLEFNVGALAPGESRDATLVCSPKTGGKHTCQARAEAEGGLLAHDRTILTAVAPRLQVQASGPGLRYVERKAVYTFRVHNPGDAAATNVVLVDIVPDGFKFLGASEGGQHDAAGRQVSWFLSEIAPGQAKEVHLELMPIALGEHRQQVVAQAAHGLKAEAETKTKVEGLAAIVTEVVDTEDPIEVGAETTYEVRVINTGSKGDTDLKLVCTVPDKMEFKTAQGPSHFHVDGKKITFEPLPQLLPRADALYRVTVKGVAAGDVRFMVQVTSANVVEPITRTESTRIYADTT
jgi:uncharacterized repeat protein (TIGR01451 family)